MYQFQNCSDGLHVCEWKVAGVGSGFAPPVCHLGVVKVDSVKMKLQIVRFRLL